ncbi:UNVERIFIED_CONTAM: hypothetical protein Sindi_1849700 [Sesamum indicum]
MIEGSSIREHGVITLSLLEKLKDLQYETTIEKSVPTVLEGKASTSKANGKVVRHEKRKKDETSSTTARTLSASVTLLSGVKDKRIRVR